ncbi:MAG: hypothetical protein PUC50_08840 [Bacteroidales bacterium]|nr:hypothetical protein [Bacteroidales bacterium]
MKKILLISVLLSALSCSGQDGRLPDKKTMNVIKKAEKVVYYGLDPMSDDSSKGQICGFAVINNRELIKNERDSLSTLVQECVSNNMNRGANKMSTFAPDNAFDFIKGTDTVSLLIDFHCDKMMVCYGTEKSKFDFDMNHNKAAQFVANLSYSKLSDKTDSSDIMETALPESIRTIIHDADSLHWYILDPIEISDDKNKLFNGWLILRQTEEANTSSIKDFFSTPSNYPQGNLIKDCTFLPDLGIRFYGKDKLTVDIMFSFYCNECSVTDGKQIFQTDCTQIRKAVLVYAKSVFPNDRYIRFMLNQ